MRRAFALSAALSTVLSGCAANLKSYVKVGDVALGRVVVYRNGVAYYERRAQVRGGRLTVSVPRDRVDDFLKSLTVVDTVTQQPLPVSFPRQQSEHGAYIDMTLEVPGRDRVADVMLTYVTESTAWKPSYRLVVADDGKVMLESWAIVDNLSGEDWKDVVVGVGSSSAMSFRYDLWSVRTVEREALTSDEHFAVAPPSAVSPYGGGGVSLDGSTEIANFYDAEIRKPVGHPDQTVDQHGVSFAGSSSAENQYIVDGATSENNVFVQPTAVTGVVRGRATDQATGMGLPGVTVVATSPALQGAHAEITDEAGIYQLRGLPPGTYSITFFYDDVQIERTGVAVGVGKTAPVFQKIDTSAARGETIVVADRAPGVDPSSSRQGVTISREYLKNIPARGRTFESVLGTAPGSQGDATAGPPPPNPIKTGDEKLAKLVPDLVRRKQAIVVEGYAAPGDGDPHARALDRANIVRNQLIDAGLPPALVRAEGKGLVAGRAAGVWLIAAAPGAGDAGAVDASATPAGPEPETPVGESHFQSDTPMTVARGTSAMVSMLRAPTTGEQVYLFDNESARGNARFAFKAVRLRNPTDSTLEAGPVTVYGEGRYIGEGLTESIPPHAAVVIPFALDRQIVVERADETRDELSRLVTLQRGVLTAEVQHVRRTRFTLTSRLHAPSRVFVRHTVEKGWLLLDSELPSERLGDARLFEVSLAAGETRTIEFAEATPLTRTLELGADATLQMMKVFVESPQPDAVLKRQLQGVLAIHRDLIDTAEKIRTLREHLIEYRNRAAELTEQIHGLKRVKSATGLVKSLADKARDTSDRIQRTTIAIVEAQERLMLARVQFQDALSELRLPPATGGSEATMTQGARGH